MKLGIGIDTGGTYTDAVIFDLEIGKVLAKAKALTTKEALEIGIGNALDALPEDLRRRAEVLSLSTTLATNACVENKGCRAKLILLGTTRDVLSWIDAEKIYGIKDEDVLCINTQGSFDGSVVEYPEWETVIEENPEFFADCQALSVAEIYAMHNGAAAEKEAKESLTARYDVPFVMGNELATDLNIMERGATAYLNARLLDIIQNFTDAVRIALEERDMHVKQMIVGSDGSLMNEDAALTYPVKTILSGPAASIYGGRSFTDCPDSLIIDMGGTTTDISIVKNDVPKMTDGIKIGPFKTQIKGVFIETFGLGGDSRIYPDMGKMKMSERRVQPMCIAAKQYPQLKDTLKRLLASTSPLLEVTAYEAFYLVREPKDMSIYEASEVRLINRLKEGPVMRGEGVRELNYVNTARLENEGVIMRCGVTPTDVMHVKGDFDAFDKEASELALRFILKHHPEYENDDAGLSDLCDEIYEMVEKKLYTSILRVLLDSEYPGIFGEGMDRQVAELVNRNWDKLNSSDFLDFSFNVKATLIGIGAPTHIFLPKVAKVLGTECIIPDDAEVSNAIGAINAQVSADVKIEVSSMRTIGSASGYFVYAPDGNHGFSDSSDAVEYAKQVASALAEEKVRQNGALTDIKVDVRVENRTIYMNRGQLLDFGAFVYAHAKGKL